MATQLTPQEWDAQFTRQASWTRATRTWLYRQAGLARARRVLDVGSGTGCVTEELASHTAAQVTGIDLDPAMVAFAGARSGRADYRTADAHDLPFDDATFDVTACHFVLLWCRDAAQAAREMLRVTRPGGAVLACAEPDYGGRIDHPALPLAHWQADALRAEGADPYLGRKLRGLFARPGLRPAEVGTIPGLWDLATLRAEFEAEWALWARTLHGHLPEAELRRLRADDWAAIDRGERLAFVPVFWAWVRVEPPGAGASEQWSR